MWDDLDYVDDETNARRTAVFSSHRLVYVYVIIDQ